MTLEAQIAEAVRSVVREEIRAALAEARPATQKELISKRAAGRMLGVDRGKGLDALIAEGSISLVPFRGGYRVRLSDVERVIAEGAGGAADQPARRGSRSEAATLRGTKV
jgi:hypothetical protein